MTKDINNNDISFFPSSFDDNKYLLDFLNKTSELICQWFTESNQLNPLPTQNHSVMASPNYSGCNSEELLRDIKKLIYSSFNPVHPGSLAHLDPPPLSVSIIGDLIAGSLNNNLLAEDLSPSISMLENELCKWLANRLGYGTNSGGIAASGGTLNNLNALVTARTNAGLEYDPEASFIISKDAHVSFNKCAKILGLMEENIILVDTDEKGRMSIKSLIKTLENVKNNQKKIFAVVGTLGTTIRGAIDPLFNINEICKEENIWLHVDASIGGVYALFNQDFLEPSNLSFGNSITINPQKIIGITKTSSLLLVENFNCLKNTFYTGLPYVDSDEDTLNRGELGVQGSRPAEIIKLWLGLRFLGINGIDLILKESINKRTSFEKLLDKDKFKIYSGPLHIISFVPKKMNVAESDLWTLNTKKFLSNNNYMISRPFYNNRYLLRIVLGNYNTNYHHLKELADILNER